VDFAQATYADSLAEVDVSGYGSGADVVPILFHTRKSVVGGSEMVWYVDDLHKRCSYQSTSWGGSSLALEVLTVSTQPTHTHCQVELSRFGEKGGLMAET
jgi:hypothetical protein